MYLKIASLVVVRGAGALFSLAAALGVTQLYGNAEGAGFFFHYSLTMVIAYLMRVGCDNGIIKFCSQDVGGESYYRLSLVVAASIGGAAFAIYFLLHGLLLGRMHRDDSVAIVLGASLFVSLLQVNGRYMQAQRWGGCAAVLQSSLLSMVMSFFLLVFYILDVENNWGGASELLLGSASLSCLVSFACVKFIAGADLSVRLPDKGIRLELYEWFRRTSTFFFTGLVNMLTQWGGQIFVGASCPGADVVTVSVGQRISNTLNLLLAATNIYVAPRVSRLYEADRFEDIADMVNRITRALLLISIISFVFVFVFGKYILGIFGVEGKVAFVCLILLYAGQCINVSTGNVALVLNFSGHERHMKICAIVGLMVGGVLLLVSSMTGSVVIASAAISCAVIVQNLIARRKVRRIFEEWKGLGSRRA